MNFITLSCFLIKICSFVIPESISFRMNTLAFYLQIGIPLSSLLVAIVYFFYNRKNGLFQKLLSIYLLVTSLGLLVSFIAINNFFVYFPHLIRTGFLFGLLVPVMLYITFCYGLLKNSFSKYTLLHFLPIVIYVINYLPYFIKSAEEKIILLEQKKLASFNEGWLLPAYFIPIMSFLQTSFYIILFIKKFSNFRLLKSSKTQFKLMRFLIGYMFIHYAPVVLMLFKLYDNHAIDSWIAITYAIANILFFFKIITTPEWLFSHEFEIMNAGTTPLAPNPSLQTSIASRLTPNLTDLSTNEKELMSRLLELCHKKKVFLQSDFNQKKVALLLDSTEYKIRTLVEKAYKMNFVEFNNHQKIQYLLQQYQQENSKWKQKKFYVISEKLGYKSLNSFYQNFKKIAGVTPGEYFNTSDNYNV